MKFTRISSLVLALTLAAALAVPASAAKTEPLIPTVREYAGQFPDVTDTWCEDAVKTVYEAGLMEGKTTDRFDAKTPLTHAQITVITARLQELLGGQDGILPAVEAEQPWYQSAADQLRASCDDNSLLDLLDQLDRRPNVPCDRRSFVRMLSAVLPESALVPINDLTVVPDCAIPEVLAFYRAGILGGSDAYGTFGEESPLTRGAAAAILARVADPEQRLTVTLKPFDLCRDVLGVPPDTVLFTAGGESVTADLFAEQLAISLYQWERDSAPRARSDAMRFWCEQQLAIHLLAQEKGFALSEDELAKVKAEAAGEAGYLGLSRDYYEFRDQTILLNSAMRTAYWEMDWKTGEADYHSDLDALASRLTPVPSEALLALDLPAVYDRLMASPYPGWVFPDYH